MNKELVPYQEALELKELGYDEEGFMKIWWLNSVHYQTKVPFKPHITMNGQDIKFQYPIPKKHPSTEFDALELQVPTFSQAFRWFREKYGDFLRHDWGEVPHFLMIQIEMTKGKTYEEAELACLRKLIEIAK